MKGKTKKALARQTIVEAALRRLQPHPERLRREKIRAELRREK